MDEVLNNQGGDYPPKDVGSQEDGEEEGLGKADVDKETKEQQEETTIGSEGGGDNDTVTGKRDYLMDDDDG